MSERAMRAAPVPAVEGVQLREGDFHQLNKQLRACYVCRLVKAQTQWLDSGCDNCRWMDPDEFDSIDSFTTPNFSGMMTVMEPSSSWVAKWTHADRLVAGCYALAINDDPPARLQEVADAHGKRIPRPLQ